MQIRFSRTGMILCHLAAVVTMVAWGGSFVSSKVLLLHGFTPTEVYVFRTLLAYLLTLAICHRRLMSNSMRDELLFVACGMLAGSLYFIAENTALEYTMVSNVSLIVTLAPLITTLLVGAVYRSEWPGNGFIAGSVIALLGVGCVIFNSSFNPDIRPLGDLLALSAAVSWAVYSLILRSLSPFYSALYITRKTFFYGMITALPFMLWNTEPIPWNRMAEPEVWGNFLFLGFFCSMGAFLLWAWVVKCIGAVRANTYLYLQPIVTLVASAVMLSESVTWVGYLGCGLILFGVWLSDRLTGNRTP